MTRIFSMVLASSLVLGLVSAGAEATKKNAPMTSGKHIPADYQKALDWCRKHANEYEGFATPTAEWGSHYGRTGWWCTYQ